MFVKVCFVGWAKASPENRTDAPASAPLALRDTLPDDAPDTDDRDTWPEMGLALGEEGRPLAEMRIELAGTPKEIDSRAHRLLDAIEREVRNVGAAWNCRIDVVSPG
jgi:hypothetical protein